MIAVNLFGGLGNQMFQYSLGRVLAVRNKDILMIDIGSFGRNNKETIRSYKLDNFIIKAEIASQDEVLSLSSTNLLKRAINRVGVYLGPFITEKTYSFDERVIKLRGDLYLHGYWQSWKYFVGFEDVVRNDFVFKKKLRSRWRELAGKIKENNAVSVHVRRQDYVNSKEIKKVLGFCGLDYYVEAMRLIRKKVKNPYFVFFSDDISWVRKSFCNKDSFFVEGNIGEYDYEDMRLMSMCKHNIIANSSFSWWAAWLNQNIDKIVVSPKNWFCDSRDDSDLIPKTWIRL